MDKEVKSINLASGECRLAWTEDGKVSVLLKHLWGGCQIDITADEARELSGALAEMADRIASERSQ